MATNRSKRLRKPEKSAKLSQEIVCYFLYGKVRRNTPAWALHISRHFDQGEERQKFLRNHEKELMQIWQKSGEKGQPWYQLNRPWKIEELI